jgi:hypothetical protein
MYRLSFWCVLIIALAGLGLSFTIIAKSFEPKQGANMILMGLPCVALPTAAVSIFLIGFLHADNGRLKRWERIVAIIVISISFLLGVPLVVLG